MKFNTTLIIISILGHVAASCASIIPAADKCRRYIIAPPMNISAITSSNLAKLWRSQNISKLAPCESIVPIEKSEEIFQYLGINYLTEAVNNNLTQSVMNNIYVKTKATHIVVLDYKENIQHTNYYLPNIYRLKDAKAVKIARLEKSILHTTSEQFSVQKKSNLIQKGINYLPNSFTINWSQKNLFDDKLNEREYKITNNNNTNSPVKALSLGATNIFHPDRYNNSLDIDWRPYISLSIDYIEQEFRPQNPEKDTALRDIRLKYFQISPIASLEFDLITVYGTSFLNLGLGAGPYWLKDSKTKNSSGLQTYANVEIGHRIFITKNIFTQISSSSATILGSTSKKDPIEKRISVDAINFSIGYFFPEIKKEIEGKLAENSI